MRFFKITFIAALVLAPTSIPLLVAAEDPHASHSLQNKAEGEPERPNEAGGGQEAQKEYYQCSMHPWIVSDKPGNCPVCGMKLTKTRAGMGAEGELVKGRAPVQITAERQKLIGVTKAEAKLRPLVYSVHSVGHVAYNPDIATALAEYRDAFTAYRRSRGNRMGQVRQAAERLLELAEYKLRISGMSSEQFEQVKSVSFDTNVLENFFAPQGLVLPEGYVWVDTDLYESDSERVRPGNKVTMASPALPGRIFEGTVKISDVVLNEFPRTLRVRIETPHKDALKAGMALDVRIEVDLGEKLSAPESAVLDSGLSKMVFVVRGEEIEPREVRTGFLADGYYEIVEGLHEGESVVTSAAFLIDSESRLRAAAQRFSKTNTEAAAPGHQH